jgi:uncharacterized membrane protein
VVPSITTVIACEFPILTPVGTIRVTARPTTVIFVVGTVVGVPPTTIDVLLYIPGVPLTVVLALKVIVIVLVPATNLPFEPVEKLTSYLDKEVGVGVSTITLAGVVVVDVWLILYDGDVYGPGSALVPIFMV